MRKKFVIDKTKPCRICGRVLSSRNRLKHNYLCKKCGRQYRYELARRKIEKNRVEFLEKHPDVRMIEGYGDKYMVSNKGKVYRITVGGVKELKVANDNSGYHSISLFNEGKRKTMKVHRLVGKAWIPNPYPYVNKIINHKDGNKINNDFNNLEWCTYKQNAVHAAKTGLIPVGEAVKGSKLTEQQVKEICALQGRVTQKKLAETYGVSKRLIMLVQKKKVWKHVKRTAPKRRLLLNRKTENGELLKPLDRTTEVVHQVIEEQLKDKDVNKEKAE